MSETRQFVTQEEAKAPYYVGVDLGGTNVKAGVVDDLGQPMSWLTIPTETPKGPEDGARRMGQAVKDAIAQAGLKPSDIIRVGLGSPGTMDIPAGKLVVPSNLKGWEHFPIASRLSEHCGLPVVFSNDATAAAYAEYWIGSGRDYNSLVLFTLGTGIGCGIIIGDTSIDGENSHGGECGHMVIRYSDDARMCECGRRGHLEAYASATAVIKRTREALENGRESSLNERLQNKCTKLDPKLVAEEAENGDPLSNEIISDTARYMGVGISVLMHTVDPSCILLGGAMTFGGNDTALGRRFLQEVKEEVNRQVFAILAERITIEYAALGGDAGFIGAAGLARAAYRKSLPS
jgi:glucokinase